MKTATINLVLDFLRNTVARYNVTPAEARVLQRMFKGVGCPPVFIVEETMPVNRSNEAEKRRLANRYPEALIEELYPGVNPNFPDNFDGIPQGRPPTPEPVLKDDE